MKLDLRPDGVLITREALGLHRAHATQASSSHIVMDLAAILRAPARAPCTSDDAFPSSFVGDNALALGTCPAGAGGHRPHTYAERCKNANDPVASGAALPQDVPLVPVVSPDRALAGPPPEKRSTTSRRDIVR